MNIFSLVPQNNIGGELMNHVTAFLIKLVSSFVLLIFILGFLYDVSVANVILITLILSFLSYIIGDLLILQRTSNAVATLADFGLALAVILIFSESLAYGSNIDVLNMSLIASAGIALFESFFHKYFVIYVVFGNEDDELQDTFVQYHTETAEEFYPSELIDDVDKDKNKEKQES